MRFLTVLTAVALLATAATTAETPNTGDEKAAATVKSDNIVVAPTGTRISAIDVTNKADGMYWYSMKDGRIVGTGPLDLHGGDDPPVPPPPDDLTERGKEIRNAALLVQGDPNRAETAKYLAELWRQISNNIKDDKINGEEAARFAVKYGTDMLLNQRNVAQNWESVREVLTEQWTDVFQRGGKDEDYAKLLDEAAAGLDASVPEGQPEIDLATILKIIELILELIDRFKVDQPAAVVPGEVPADGAAMPTPDTNGSTTQVDVFHIVV